MPKLFSSQHIVNTLARRGFIFISQKGSHAKFRKKSGNKMLTVIAPMGRHEIPFGTFRSILRQSQLGREDFFS